MNINTSFAADAYKDISASVSKDLEDKKELSAKDITNSYLAQYQLQIASESKGEVGKQFEMFSLSDIGYEGKAIGDLSQSEAKELVSEDGFFGITQTSERIAGFVLSGAGDDVEKLQAGRAGILQGFKEAEEMWGGTLPDISYETINSAVEQIDARLSELGAPIMDTNA